MSHFRPDDDPPRDAPGADGPADRPDPVPHDPSPIPFPPPPAYPPRPDMPRERPLEAEPNGAYPPPRTVPRGEAHPPQSSAGHSEPPGVPDRLDPAAARFGEFRELMLAWCVWLLASWGLTLWVDAPVAAARWMIYLALLGLMLGWPLLRLSQVNGRTRPARSTLLDWLGLMMVLQAVVWPLRLATGLLNPLWDVPQALWIVAALAAWSLLVGAVVAGGRRFYSGGARTVAMAICVLLLVGEPLVMLLLGGGWTLWVSPAGVLSELLGPRHAVAYDEVARRVVPAAIAAVGAWIGLGGLTLVQRRRGVR